MQFLILAALLCASSCMSLELDAGADGSANANSRYGYNPYNPYNPYSPYVSPYNNYYPNNYLSPYVDPYGYNPYNPYYRDGARNNLNRNVNLNRNLGLSPLAGLGGLNRDQLGAPLLLSSPYNRDAQANSPLGSQLGANMN